jgi:hypothetical protein
MWSEGSGSGGDAAHRRADDRRHAHAPLLSMFVIPAAYLLMRRRTFNREGASK